MIEYITFDEYLDLGGVIEDEDAFNRAYRRARAELDYRTLGRLRNESEVDADVKQCMAEMIDVCAAGYALYGSPDGVQAVQSVSNDGVSVSYATATINDWFGTVYPGRVAGVIDLYLSDKVNSRGQQLLYRGCR